VQAAHAPRAAHAVVPLFVDGLPPPPRLPLPRPPAHPPGLPMFPEGVPLGLAPPAAPPGVVPIWRAPPPPPPPRRRPAGVPAAPPRPRWMDVEADQGEEKDVDSDLEYDMDDFDLQLHAAFEMDDEMEDRDDAAEMPQLRQAAARAAAAAALARQAAAAGRAELVHAPHPEFEQELESSPPPDMMQVEERVDRVAEENAEHVRNIAIIIAKLERLLEEPLSGVDPDVESSPRLQTHGRVWWAVPSTSQTS